MPVMSSTCRVGPRPTRWMRSGLPRSPSGRCCGPASCRHRRSGSCGTWPATGRIWWRPAPPRSSGSSRLLEDAQIKLSVVASDIFGVSGRAMLAALLAGERDPKVLAQLARARMRAKLGPLAEAFTGFFTDHHAFLLAKMLARVDALDADIAELDAKLDELIAPFAGAVDRLDEIPGVGQLAARLLIAEIGTDMARFPTAGHLVSWAKFAPGRQGVRRQDQGQRHRPGTATRIWPGCSARPPSPPAGPIPSWVNATGASPAAAAPRRRHRRGRPVHPGHRLAPAVRPRAPASTTWAPASTTPASTPSAPSATTSASWRPSATRSPSNPPPDRGTASTLPGPGSAALRRVLPPACSPWIFGSVEVSRGDVA